MNTNSESDAKTTRARPGRRTAVLLIGAAFAAGVAAAWVDTAGYRTALAGLASQEALLAKITMETKDDFAMFAECKSKRVENPVSGAVEPGPAMRSCLLDSMPRNKTAFGGFLFGSAASIWLTSHPDDNEIRDAALVSIENGRRELASSAGFLEAARKTVDAHDGSVILRLLEGRSRGFGRDMFSAAADRLDDAEYSVRLPDVHNRQAVWRFDVQTSIIPARLQNN